MPERQVQEGESCFWQVLLIGADIVFDSCYIYHLKKHAAHANVGDYCGYSGPRNWNFISRQNALLQVQVCHGHGAAAFEHCGSRPRVYSVRIQAEALAESSDPSAVTRSYGSVLPATSSTRKTANLLLQIGDDGQRINES
jgi:hypothetical protein